jgi:hypothetical protein
MQDSRSIADARLQVTYQLTQKDFVESLKAYRERSTFRRWLWRLIPAIPLGLAGFGILIYFETSDPQVVSNLAPLIVLAVFWVVLLWASPRLGARMQFRKQPAAHAPKTISLDSSGVHWRWEGGSSDIDWKSFLKWQESTTQFLLYTSPVIFNMIPKRIFTEEQISEIRLLLSKNIPVPVIR